MRKEESPVEKTSGAPARRAGLNAHTDARALVRLVQCPQCSRPFKNPVALPCGRAICRGCLPQSHEREPVSYPGSAGRRQGVRCPFEECGREHPVTDCNADVTLSKVMESIAEVVVKNRSLFEHVPTVVEEVGRYNEAISLDEKSSFYESYGGRLLATYTLAAEGWLGFKTDLNYDSDPVASESQRVLDVKVLQDLTELTHKELDCQACYDLMLDPVTTFCGHTLCRRCMARVMDHASNCPVCRRGLAIQPIMTRQPSNQTLVELLSALCPDTIAARSEAVAAEELGALGELNTPLFICTLGFPHQPTFLRIFEPRYRLMLRRCIEGNGEFGMLMYNRYGEPQGDLGAVQFYHYGTMLRIVHSELLADGTSLIETRGSYRFRVKAHGMVDGYSVGNVERHEDVSLAEEEQIEAVETALPPAAESDVAAQLDRMTTRGLLALGHDFIRRMQERSANWLQQRVLDIHGQAPEDPAVFPYWFASVLPISDEEKYKLLGTQTVRERLKITAGWIRRIESQRWYQSNSCRIL